MTGRCRGYLSELCNSVLPVLCHDTIPSHVRGDVEFTWFARRKGRRRNRSEGVWQSRCKHLAPGPGNPDALFSGSNLFAIKHTSTHVHTHISLVLGACFLCSATHHLLSPSSTPISLQVARSDLQVQQQASQQNHNHCWDEFTGGLAPKKKSFLRRWKPMNNLETRCCVGAKEIGVGWVEMEDDGRVPCCYCCCCCWYFGLRLL